MTGHCYLFIHAGAVISASGSQPVSQPVMTGLLCVGPVLQPVPVWAELLHHDELMDSFTCNFNPELNDALIEYL